MTPFCVWLGGGSHDTLMLELLLGFTTVTVTALGGALGTERTSRASGKKDDQEREGRHPLPS